MNRSALILSSLCLLLANPAWAGTDNGCKAQEHYQCLDMPGLSIGQTIEVKEDITFDQFNNWRYFANGKPINLNVLARRIGRTYCGLRPIPDSQSHNESRIEKGTYTLFTMSWYVNQIFFRSENKGFVLICSKVDKAFSSSGATSSEAIAKELTEILELK